MPINRIYPKALYNIIVEKYPANFLTIQFEYMTNYNENTDTYDGRTQLYKRFPLNNLTWTYELDALSGTNLYCEVSSNNTSISISQGEYVWYGNAASTVDPSFFYGLIDTALNS